MNFGKYVSNSHNRETIGFTTILFIEKVNVNFISMSTFKT